MLNYRRYPLAKIPEQFHAFVQPFVMPGREPMVVVLDNRLLRRSPAGSPERFAA